MNRLLRAACIALLGASCVSVLAAERVTLTLGTKGSGLVILSRYVLDGIGLKQGQDFQAVYLDRAGDGPSMALDGRVAAIDSVGSWSFVLARPTLDDKTAYRLIRAVHRGEAALARRLPAAAETTAANTLAATPTRERQHPGVLRYLREVGIAR